MNELGKKIALIACPHNKKPCLIYCPCPFFEKEADQIQAEVEQHDEQRRKDIILELEEDGLLAHEIMSYGASGRECEETCGSCKLLRAIKEV